MNSPQFEYGACWVMNAETGKQVALSSRRDLATGEVHALWSLNSSEYWLRIDQPLWKNFRKYNEITNQDFYHLGWIYDRMKYVHNENESSDYMIRFRQILDKIETI